jgi:NAD+ kinase
MARRFRHAALVGKYQADGIRPLLEEIAHFLVRQGLEVSFERDTAQATGVTTSTPRPADQIGQQCDLAVVVGGDGTMLGIARELARHNLPLVGINQGRLGFITDMPHRPVPRGAGADDRRRLRRRAPLHAGRRGLARRHRIFEGLSLNDVVVSRGATASMVELRVDIGDDFVANMRADGLIVASPTGSTAYALSAGGPILHPGIAGWVLVPIASTRCPTGPSCCPTAASAHHGRGRRDASANFDMHTPGQPAARRPGARARSAHKVRFLHPRGWSYYATLRRKLRWYEGVV